MTWTNRFRLWGGVLLVALLVVAGALLFNQRQSRVASYTATVDAPAAQVGSSYGGVLTEQHVNAGALVKAGDRLFTVSSPDIAREAAQGYAPQSNDAYDVDVEAGTITYRAVIDGQVTNVQTVTGSYLVPGSSLATVAAEGPKTVVARFDLEAVDYSRVESGARATINLADNSQVDGTVTDVAVVTEDGRAIASVRVEAPGLADSQHASLTRAGAPVQVVMDLRDDGLLAGPTHVVVQFLTKVGLR